MGTPALRWEVCRKSDGEPRTGVGEGQTCPAVEMGGGMENVRRNPGDLRDGRGRIL